MAAPGASETVVVVTGGDPVDPAHAARPCRPAPSSSRSTRASSTPRRSGWPIDLAIGDFDSVDPQRLAQAEAAGAVVERHPVAKDATDLELALDAAIALGPARILVLGGHGGRLDHLLANALAPRRAGLRRGRGHRPDGPARLTVVRDAAELTGPLGDLVSLAAPPRRRARASPPAACSTRSSARTCHPGSTRGVSNELAAPPPPSRSSERRARGHPARRRSAPTTRSAPDDHSRCVAALLAGLAVCLLAASRAATTTPATRAPTRRPRCGSSPTTRSC